jgi:hypothetical protein
MNGSTGGVGASVDLEGRMAKSRRSPSSTDTRPTEPSTRRARFVPTHGPSTKTAWARATRFGVESALINIRAASATSLRVVEVPGVESARREGVSNLRAHRDGTRVLRTILAEWLRPV